jgi:hypothetical protein
MYETNTILIDNLVLKLLSKMLVGAMVNKTVHAVGMDLSATNA